MKHRINRWLGLTVLLLIAGSVAGQEASSPFYLTFIPNVQFAPIYVAIENGYFQAAGQPVSIEYLSEPDVVDLVATGQARYGVVSAEQVILAGANGRPITYVYNWYHDYPVALVTDAAVIPTLADLPGKTVGVPIRSGATYTGLSALLNVSGLTEADIDLQEIGFNAPEAFCLGRVQAASVYSNNEPLQIQALIDDNQCGDVREIAVFPVSAALPLVSNGIIASDDFLAASPELVASFVAAYHQGLLDTINNPAEAYLLSALHVENLPLDDLLRAELTAQAETQATFLATNPTRELIAESRATFSQAMHERFDRTALLQLDVLLNTIDLWDTATIGVTEADAWDNMVRVLSELGQLPDATAGLDDLYTNEFVPEPSLAPGA